MEPVAHQTTQLFLSLQLPIFVQPALPALYLAPVHGHGLARDQMEEHLLVVMLKKQLPQLQLMDLVVHLTIPR